MGLVVAHVDDFLLAGDETCDKWHNAVSGFYHKFRWSPWEVSSYNHCIVKFRVLESGIVTPN